MIDSMYNVCVLKRKKNVLSEFLSHAGAFSPHSQHPHEVGAISRTSLGEAAGFLLAQGHLAHWCEDRYLTDLRDKICSEKPQRSIIRFSSTVSPSRICP